MSEASPFNPVGCGPITPADVPNCPHCGQPMLLFMPVPELLYGGPVAVCRNDDCGYYVRSEAHTKRQMGFSLRYRHVMVMAERKDMPVACSVCDDERQFWPMGATEEACQSWRVALEWYEQAKRDALAAVEVESVAVPAGCWPGVRVVEIK